MIEHKPLNRDKLRRYAISGLVVLTLEGLVLYGLSRGVRSPPADEPAPVMEIVLLDWPRHRRETPPDSGQEALTPWSPRETGPGRAPSDTVGAIESPARAPAPPIELSPAWTVRRANTPDHRVIEAMRCVSDGGRWRAAELSCDTNAPALSRTDIPAALPRGQRAAWDEVIRRRSLPPEEPMAPCPKDRPGGNFGVACLPTRD